MNYLSPVHLSPQLKCSAASVDWRPAPPTYCRQVCLRRERKRLFLPCPELRCGPLWHVPLFAEQVLNVTWRVQSVISNGLKVSSLRSSCGVGTSVYQPIHPCVDNTIRFRVRGRHKKQTNILIESVLFRPHNHCMQCVANSVYINFYSFLYIIIQLFYCFRNANKQTRRSFIFLPFSQLS